MRRSKVILVMRKEWRDILANRLLLASMALFPVVMTALPIVVVAIATRTATEANTAELREALKDLPEGLTAAQLVVHMLVRNWIGMFLMLPVFVPIVIAAQAVVGEKEARTIEPLLASPLSSGEILLGKTLAAFVPGVVIAWGSFAIFAAGVNVLAWETFRGPVVPDATWLVAVFVVGPLLALFGNGLAVLVSSRVNDARLAQQLAGIAVLPLVGLMVVQMARGLAFGPAFYAIASGLLALIDFVLYRVAIRLFDRERILTSLR